ncbi:MAG: alkaline phosphatase D family protein [Pseudomonadota bacterium]
MTDHDMPLVGPILMLDDVDGATCRLSAIFIARHPATVPPLSVEGTIHEAEHLLGFADHAVYRIRFTVPADRPSSYTWNGETFDLASDFRADLRLAFVSCNGEEHGDLAREGGERNAMWARLATQHREAPFALLLHGGDQIYADEATKGHPLSEHWPDRLPRDPSRADLASLREHLRERFLERYLAIYAAPEIAWLLARVPSLMQWDDHDICDGWGSLQRSRTYSPVGQVLFAVARETALALQHGSVEGDLPSRFGDPAGNHLGWCVEAPGLRILAPDLRSERTRRNIMGPAGWAFVEDVCAGPPVPQTLLMSSVPLLGPRLSILETLMVMVPTMQKYEDDLRDQWQSRAHRQEWRRMLGLLRDMVGSTGSEVTTLSGEIHLATQAEMALGEGRMLHQLVASGIAHRAPPKAWARALGTIASLGENPLEGHPIRIKPLPGQRGRYVAERNALMLERGAAGWHARWDLEISGLTEALPLTSG